MFNPNQQYNNVYFQQSQIHPNNNLDNTSINNLYYGGYKITMNQIYYIDYVFSRYYKNPFNCFHRHLPQLEIIRDCLTINLKEPFNFHIYRIIAEQLYIIAKDLTYELSIYGQFQIDKIFGDYENPINSEESVITDFVNKMTHTLTYREYDRSKIILLIIGYIEQIKQANAQIIFSKKYREEEDKKIYKRINEYYNDQKFYKN